MSAAVTSDSSRVYPDPAKSVGPFAGFCTASGGTVVGADGKPVPPAPPGKKPALPGTNCMGGSVNVTTATNTTSGDLGAVTSAVSAADFVVVVAGLTPQDEGEEYTYAADRDTKCISPGACLQLDAKQPTATYQGIQNKLIQQVAASGKPFVVVLEGGSVIEMPWLSQVPAVVMAWYPGQRGGEAMADLLWGEVNGASYNFGGKLPFTWGHEQQYGDPFNSGGGTTTFDYYIGYRYFDHNNLTPAYPFGAGLSYTTFQLSKLQLGCSSMTQGAVLPVVVNVKNTGTVAGDDTVMVFVSFPNTAVGRRIGQKELKGFARVSLAAGEAKQVTIPVRLSDLDYFQADSPTATTGHWVVEGGAVNIMVTDGSQNPADGKTIFLPTQSVTVPRDSPSDLLNENNCPLCPDPRSPDRVRSLRGIDRTGRRGRWLRRKRRRPRPHLPARKRHHRRRRRCWLFPSCQTRRSPRQRRPGKPRQSGARSRLPPSRPSRRPRSPRSVSSACPARLTPSRRRAASSTARCGSPSTACSGLICLPRRAAIGSSSAFPGGVGSTPPT